jgi:hypothetical protein
VLKQQISAAADCGSMEGVLYVGARGGAVVEVLRYKPEGRGLDSRSCHWIYSLT